MDFLVIGDSFSEMHHFWRGLRNTTFTLMLTTIILGLVMTLYQLKYSWPILDVEVRGKVEAEGAVIDRSDAFDMLSGEGNQAVADHNNVRRVRALAFRAAALFYVITVNINFQIL